MSAQRHKYCDVSREERTMSQHFENESSAVPHISTTEYYQSKFSELVAWLESEELKQDAQAERDEDAGNREGFQFRQGQGNLAFRARMWIRKNVIMSQ